jgi:hypothetical protein
METPVPRLSSSSNSQFIKIFNTASLSFIAAMYSAVCTTLCGTGIGTYLLSTEIDNDDLIYDMKISAVSMAALLMLSYPYQNIRELPSFDDLLDHYPYLVINILLIGPIIIPISVNKMARETDFPEWSALALGGLITQLLTLVFILILIRFSLKSKAVIKVMEYIAELTMADEADIVTHQRSIIDRHVRYQHYTHESVLEAMIKKLYANARQFQESLNLANARLIVKKIKIAMMRPALRYLLTAWHAEYHDPYSYYFSKNIDKLEPRYAQDLQQLLSNLEENDEDLSELLYNEKKVFSLNENIFLLNIKAMEEQNNKTLLTIQMMCGALIKLAPEIKNTILLNSIVPEPTVEEVKPELEEKKIEVSPTNSPLTESVETKRLEPTVEEVKPEHDEKKIEVSPLNTPLAVSVDTKRLEPNEKNKKKQNKKKAKPQLRLSDICTPNRTAFFQPASIEPSKIEESIPVKLTELENKVFALLDSLLPTRDYAYKTYIVGGWAYDKVRETDREIPPCQYNDIDLVTEIPPSILCSVFSKIPEVKGLFCWKLDGIKIDIVHVSDLSDLLLDAKDRDFMTFYIDKTGKVYDPTKQALTNLRLGLLHSVNPPEKMFQEDPLVILRVIYVTTKRNLSYDGFKSMMTAHRMAMSPRLEDSNPEAERILHPHRMNLRIAKLFSQHFAAKNLEILLRLELLEVLIPSIYPDVFAGFDWIQEQMSITTTFPWPKLAIIYATLIATAIVHRNPKLDYGRNDNPNIIDKDILALATEIGTKSLLFRDAFTDPNELNNYLRRPLKMYSQYYMNKSMETNERNEFARIRHC